MADDIAGLPVAALIFLSVIAFFLLSLVLMFMYLNKKACFANCGGCPCLEEKKAARKKEKDKDKLVESYGYDDDDESSSDSDNEVMLRYQQSISAPIDTKPSVNSFKKKPLQSLKSSNGTKPATGKPRGTRADDLSLAEQGGKHGSGSESIASSERLGGYEGDTQNIVGEPADEGLIAGVGDDILYPEEALLDPSQRDPVSICGEMDVVFQYSGEARRMNVTIVQAYNLPTKEQGGSSSYRVRLLLYPTKRQRAKTRIREGSDPQYKELFRFTRLYPHELVSMVLRLRLYGSERMRRERLIGEGRVKFSSLNTATQQMVRVKLESKSEIATGGSGSPYSSSSDLSHSESNSSLPTLQGGHGNIPELLVGLSYNATTGRLGVEIIKGSHFKHLSGGRAPDSYVKVALMSSSGFEMTKSKTSVRRGQPHPTFKETFIFQVAQFQLADVTLLFTVFNKKGMKRKDTIGWFSMGLSNSSEEELAHWNEMRESRGQQVSRWHALIDS
ncbi:synaptotagmin-16-like isoform X4 [Amphiura filiformis]|uniref:synaptotagmin-16-like isoform X4 n=1 Tax=Amphiura filiformis TaxID=82378 RepID=UPI003B219465